MVCIIIQVCIPHLYLSFEQVGDIMKIDLSELVVDSARNKHSNDEGFVSKTKEFTVYPEMTTIALKGVEYAIQDVGKTILNVKSLGGNKVEINGKGNIVLDIPCDRCLECQSVDVTFEIDREVDFNNPEPVEDENLIDDNCIDVDVLLYPEIIMNLPMKTLCKEDCKGICRACGINLNKQSCDCDTFVPDPRMAVISDIFKQFNQ